MENPRLTREKRRKGNDKSCLTTLFYVYKSGAIKRKYVFELTREQFKELTKQDCWYCGQEPAQIKRNYGRKAIKDAYYLYNGVDRVDNAVGYTEANCISCCGTCNRMKNVLHAEDFIIHIRKIVRNLNIF